MTKPRSIGHGERYFDFQHGRLFENVQSAKTTSRTMPPEFDLTRGCRVVYRDTGQNVPHPLRYSEAASYVIRQMMDEIWDLPVIDEFTGKPREEWEWRECRVIPGHPLSGNWDY